MDSERDESEEDEDQEEHEDITESSEEYNRLCRLFCVDSSIFSSPNVDFLYNTEGDIGKRSRLFLILAQD